MSIQLVAIDIDGTLIDSKHTIRPRVKKAILKAKQQGVKIVLCTGRPLPGVKNYLTELELFDEGDYAITYNGSLVQSTADAKTIVKYGLSYEDFLEIETMSRRVGSHLHTIDENYIYTANRNISAYTVNEAYLVGMPLLYRTVDEMDEQINIIKMMLIDDPEILDNAITKLPQWFLDRYTTAKSDAFYFEVLNKQASKGNAVRSLAKELGIPQTDVMAIGDNENDLSMLEYAGLSVAMGNAVASVKKTADQITATNDEEGVAIALEKYVLAN